MSGSSAGVRSLRSKLGMSVGALLTVLAFACTEELTVPGGCPDLCLGEPPVVELVIPVLPNSDSSHIGYIGLAEVPALLVSDGLEAGEARAWYRLESRPDSVSVGGTNMTYTIDSMALQVPLVARDTAVRGLVLYLHRIPLTIDTLTTFAELDAALSPGSLIDSLIVADTVRNGATLRFLLTDETLGRVEIPPEDSGRIAVGFRMRADASSGVRLGALASVAGPARFTTYARVDVADTAQQRQTLNVSSEANGYVLSLSRTLDPDLLYVGGAPSARTLLRFDASGIPDSAVLLRATLELETAEVLHGLPNDAALLDARPVSRDLGAKSTPIFALNQAVLLPEGKDTTVSVEVLALVSLWRSSDSLPRIVYLSMTPEAASFSQPVFRSSRSGSGAPRLRVNYMLRPRIERP